LLGWRWVSFCPPVFNQGDQGLVQNFYQALTVYMELSKFILTSKLYAFNRFIGYVSLKNKEKELFSALLW
jgi:hydrogenase-4 membrane subunit HyfE